MSGSFGLSAAMIGQLVNLCAAMMLLLGFAMLAQRRILSLINLFMLQGLVLVVSTLVVAHSTGRACSSAGPAGTCGARGRVNELEGDQHWDRA